MGNLRCENYSNDAEFHERFKNVIHLDINGDSIGEIVSNYLIGVKSEIRKCLWCKHVTKHNRKTNMIITPSVLILSLQRFECTLFLVYS